ncbi:hypothetical protein BDZ89DRAFT_1073793 [Hymenopellis radicata]|nr:hypothetical protein BDZ89DRAFT_1073793 [Hymenopellis radicata]
MTDMSIPAYIGIHIAIGLLRAIAPASFRLHLRLHNIAQLLVLSMDILLAVPEALFYLFGYLPRQSKIIRPPLHAPERLTKEERERMFLNCTQNPANLPQWFLSSDSSAIKRENVIDWLLWAFFEVKAEDVEKEELVEWSDEINSYVEALEKVVGHSFPPGRNNEVKSMRLSFDPVVTLHRPLIWYIIVGFLDMFTACNFAVTGLKHYAPTRWFQEFPSRPWTILSRKSVTPEVPYWFRPHRSTTKKPIIFIHGIGIGLFPYIPFMRELDPEVGILLIEILPVSTRMTSMPVLPRPVMLDTFYTITSSLNISEAILISHSYGTVVAGHIMRSQQLARREKLPPLPTKITAYCFVDPIPFPYISLTSHSIFSLPDTEQCQRMAVWFFASRDADVGRTLGRHFFWMENVLFKEDLEGETVGVIVPAKHVWTYLTGEEADDESHRWISESSMLEVLYYPSADHATIFDRKRTRSRLLEIIDRLSSGPVE